MAAKLKGQPALLKKVLQRAEITFEDLDADGDGSISREEVKKFFGSSCRSLGENKWQNGQSYQLYCYIAPI